MIHPNAIVETSAIGKDTRIWAFVHILPGAVIGADCNLCDHVFIENDVIIGDRVTIKSGVQIWDGITVEDDVFIGPNATFTNDPFPRSKQFLAHYPRTTLHQGASIGANATILPGLSIGQYAMIGAGTVVTKNVPPFAIVVGNPARIIGYADTEQSAAPLAEKTPAAATQDVGVNGVQLYHFPVIEDLRGSLTFAEINNNLPFIPHRFFMTFNVPSKEIRGEHAHRACHQFLVCVKGSCAVVVDDGHHRAEITLDRPHLGLHIPPLIWATEYKYSPDAVLLVFASDIYKEEDYLRDYNDFLQEVENQ
jgi:acetyltransferase-like isoleucine patch superfamily enzyme/dTDP-4-dehydrorhamnose 3,5-epimerase-like enzyme